MAIRKNKKRIDPRYFLNETTYRDLDESMYGTFKQHWNDEYTWKMVTPNSIISIYKGINSNNPQKFIDDLPYEWQKPKVTKALQDAGILKATAPAAEPTADSGVKGAYSGPDDGRTQAKSTADLRMDKSGRVSEQENLGGGADMAKAEELAATFQKSPTIMAAVEQAMRDPEVQKALEQATAGGLQEEEDPYADDPVGAAYQKKAQLAGAGEVASAGVGAVGAGAVVGPAILTTIAGKMVVTGAIAALGIAGGAALMGLAIVAALAFQSRRTDASQKAKGYVNRDARDFGREEWEKLHSGE